jgi:8-amino-7-oxononanoate synthase
VWQARFQQELHALEEAGLRRSLEANAAPQGTTIRVGSESLLNFCSNDYLGLAAHPRIGEALHEGALRYGVGSGAAALLSGHSAAHAMLAEELARATGRERALIFSSGYLANLGIFSGLVARTDTVISDSLNHASLIDGVRLSRADNRRYPHADMAAATAVLKDTAESPQWLVSDGLFSMDGDLAPLPQLAELAHRHQAILVCDDAHGFGVVGDGRGTLAHYKLDMNNVPLLVVTFGKALGTSGAAVIGPSLLIEMLLQRARTFIFDTAPSPALMHATRVALTMTLGDEEGIRSRLSANIRLFKAWRKSAGLPVPVADTPIQPLWVGDEQRALFIAAKLRAAGFYVRAIRPPTVPAGTARLRVCLSAAHEPAQIEALTDALQVHRTSFLPYG